MMMLFDVSVKTFKMPAPPVGVPPPEATPAAAPVAPEDKVFEEAPQEVRKNTVKPVLSDHPFR